MTAWTNDELAKIGAAEEVQIAPRRRDGKLRNPVTVWIVRHGDGLYIRSAVRGRSAIWFSAVQETHQGRISADGLEKDVAFADADPNGYDEIDAAYRTKYRRYVGRILNSCLTPEARSTTIKVMPRSTGP
jgi:hypothetical protein